MTLWALSGFMAPITSLALRGGSDPLVRPDCTGSARHLPVPFFVEWLTVFGPWITPHLQAWIVYTIPEDVDD